MKDSTLLVIVTVCDKAHIYTSLITEVYSKGIFILVFVQT